MGNGGDRRERASSIGYGVAGTAAMTALALAATVAVVTSMAACGGGGSGATPDAGSPSSTGTSPTGAGAGTDAGAGPNPAPHGGIQYVFVIAMENDDADVFGDAAGFPYLNGVLLPQAARAATFVDELPLDIPSEPHYVWMEAGTNAFTDHTFTDDANPSATNSTATGDHLTAQLARAGNGTDWTTYQEGIDAESGACPIASSGDYRPRHNPFVFFQDLAGTPPSKTAPTCAAHHKPLSALESDLAAGSLKTYTFITPNLCHDAHGHAGCPTSKVVRSSDDWMRATLPSILAFVGANEGAIFIVWDEGQSTANLPFLALGPHVKAGYTGAASYDHSSLVRSLDEILGLPILPAVASANDFADLFEPGFFP